MSPERGSNGPEIGQALKDARRRIGMDVAEAEEQTKIRAKYLRALEAEDWEVLPAPAYVRGFLRTYGALLGLDGEMLADEFRRRHEAPATTSPATEPFLRGRRNSGARAPSRAPLIAGVALAIVALLVALSLLGGGDDDGEPTTLQPDDPPAKTNGGKRGKDRGGGAPKEEKPRKPIDFALEPLGSVGVCVVASGEPLIDGQVLAEGAVEQFEGAKRYRVDLEDQGVVRVEAAGESKKLQAAGASSWEADSNGIRSIEYAGPDCP